MVKSMVKSQLMQVTFLAKPTQALYCPQETNPSVEPHTSLVVGAVDGWNQIDGINDIL